MAWDAEVVAEWERREHKIRQEIDALRSELEGKYKRQIEWLNKALEEQQKYVITIHEMPILGRWVRHYAEQKTKIIET